MRRVMPRRTTLILGEGLIERAMALTGLTEKTAVVHAGLRALIVQHSAKKAGSARQLGPTGPGAPEATALADEEMILVDTSVWIDHFRSTLPALVRLLEDGEVILTGLERPAGRRSASKRHLHRT